MDINLKKRGFYRGVNLGGWFSQCDYCKEHMDTFITEDDFSRIASWGLDHVRIPVDYNVLEHQDGSIRRSGYVRIDKAVSLCEKYGLHLVLDLHKTAGFSFDDYGESEYGFFESPQYQERFYHLWEEIARHYGRKPESIAFELLNEVTDKAYHTTWNAIVRRCITRIRAIAPATLILVGGYHNNSAEAVKDLAPPFDKHVVYNMHCYEPLRFTHQGAYWTDKIQPEKRFSVADCHITEEYFENLFASAIARAESCHTALYCGEYGVIDTVDPQQTLEWYRILHNVFEKYHIGRCAWCYQKMDFGLMDARLDTVRSEILKNL